MRGKKFNDDVKEKALAMLATNNNTSEIAKKLGIPNSTLRTWALQGSPNDSFAKLRQKKKKEFIEKAWRIIEKAQGLMVQQLDDKEYVHDIGKLSTVIGTMYDKQALACNETTQNMGTVKIEDLLDKVQSDSDY